MSSSRNSFSALGTGPQNKTSKNSSGGASVPPVPALRSHVAGLDSNSEVFRLCTEAGFSQGAIHAAVHRLWDRGGRYDDPGTVIDELTATTPQLRALNAASAGAPFHQAQQQRGNGAYPAAASSGRSGMSELHLDGGSAAGPYSARGRRLDSVVSVASALSQSAGSVGGESAAATDAMEADVAASLCAVAVIPDLTGTVLPGIEAWAEAVRGEGSADKLSTALLSCDFLPLLFANILRAAPPSTDGGALDAQLSSAITALLTPVPSALAAAIAPCLPPDFADVVTDPLELPPEAAAAAASGGSASAPAAGSLVGAACASAAGRAIGGSVRRVIDAIAPLVREEESLLAQRQLSLQGSATGIDDGSSDRLGTIIDAIALGLSGAVRGFAGEQGTTALAAAAAITGLRARLASADAEIRELASHPAPAGGSGADGGALRALLARRDAAATLASGYTAAARVALRGASAVGGGGDAGVPSSASASAEARELETALAQLSFPPPASSATGVGNAAMAMLGLTLGSGRGGTPTAASAVSAEASAAASLASLRREVDAATGPARAALASAAARETSLASRRAELLAELDRVSAQLSEAADERARASAVLDTASAPFATRLAHAEAAHARAASALARATAASRVREELVGLSAALGAPSPLPASISGARQQPSNVANTSIFATLLARAVESLSTLGTAVAASGGGASGYSGGLAGATLSPLLACVHGYLCCEEQLIHAIACRAATSRATAGVLTAEQRQYRGLGLSTVAAEFEGKARAALADAEEDDATVAALRQAASAVLSSARTDVLEPLVASAIGSSALSPPQVGWLHRIRAAASRCGLGAPHMPSSWELPPNTDPGRASYVADLSETPRPVVVLPPQTSAAAVAHSSTGASSGASLPVPPSSGGSATARLISPRTAGGKLGAPSGGSRSPATASPSGVGGAAGGAPGTPNSSVSTGPGTRASSGAAAPSNVLLTSLASLGGGGGGGGGSLSGPGSSWGDIALASAPSGSSGSAPSAPSGSGVGALGSAAAVILGAANGSGAQPPLPPRSPRIQQQLASMQAQQLLTLLRGQPPLPPGPPPSTPVPPSPSLPPGQPPLPPMPPMRSGLGGFTGGLPGAARSSIHSVGSASSGSRPLSSSSMGSQYGQHMQQQQHHQQRQRAGSAGGSAPGSPARGGGVGVLPVPGLPLRPAGSGAISSQFGHGNGNGAVPSGSRPAPWASPSKK